MYKYIYTCIYIYIYVVYNVICVYVTCVYIIPAYTCQMPKKWSGVSRIKLNLAIEPIA